MLNVLATLILLLILNGATIHVYTPQQAHAQGVIGAIRLAGEIVPLAQSLFDLYDTVKSHMTPQESSVTLTGLEHFRSGNYKDAANSFDQALQIDQNNIVALNGKALTAGSQGDLSQALKYFDQALQIEPNNFEALVRKV